MTCTPLGTALQKLEQLHFSMTVRDNKMVESLYFYYFTMYSTFYLHDLDSTTAYNKGNKKKLQEVIQINGFVQIFKETKLEISN